VKHLWVMLCVTMTLGVMRSMTCWLRAGSRELDFTPELFELTDGIADRSDRPAGTPPPGPDRAGGTLAAAGTDFIGVHLSGS
jgi:hypothetical protein